MSASSEHEFESRVGRNNRHVRILENPDDVTRNPKIKKSTWPRGISTQDIRNTVNSYNKLIKLNHLEKWSDCCRCPTILIEQRYSKCINIKIAHIFFTQKSQIY